MGRMKDTATELPDTSLEDCEQQHHEDFQRWLAALDLKSAEEMAAWVEWAEVSNQEYEDYGV